jgi:hypothetical protein
MEKKYRKILGQGVGVSQRFGWARKLVVGLMVGVVTLVGLSSCENNLLEVLGRDVFFRNVVDPYSIRVDFEYRGSLDVNPQYPVYFQIIGVVDDVLIIPPPAFVYIGPITGRNQTIIIPKEEIDRLGSNPQSYILRVAHDLYPNFDDKDYPFDRGLSGNTPDLELVYSTKFPGNLTMDFWSVLARLPDESVDPRTTEVQWYIDNRSQVRRGNRYSVILFDHSIEKDAYEPDYELNISVLKNIENKFLVVDNPQERTIHWQDRDRIFLEPDLVGDYSIEFTLDNKPDRTGTPTFIPGEDVPLDVYNIPSFWIGASVHMVDDANPFGVFVDGTDKAFSVNMSSENLIIPLTGLDDSNRYYIDVSGYSWGNESPDPPTLDFNHRAIGWYTITLKANN